MNSLLHLNQNIENKYRGYRNSMGKLDEQMYQGIPGILNGMILAENNTVHRGF